MEDDSVEDAIKLLSGWQHAHVKRSTSFFDIEADFWFDPQDPQKSKQELVEKLTQEIMKSEKSHKYDYEIRTSVDYYQIAPHEFQVTVKKNGLIQYGEKVRLFDDNR